MIRSLDHVNLRTADVDRMVRFYVDIIGLRQGDRPPFDFPGAWLYAGDRPVVHLVGVDVEPRASSPAGALSLEHFALFADGLGAFVGHLEAQGIAYRRSRQTGSGKTVINLRDPDGNRFHVDFEASRSDD
jgi:catechol 2,3-dioxygenase-like lactoylglutathione lyase family enzyme